MNYPSARPQHLVVIGTSSGGVETLRELIAGIPADFPGAIAVVMHTAPQSPGSLHTILGRVAHLECISPSGISPLRAGVVYVAPPDYHLLVEPGHLSISKGPKENRFRPAIDPLFRSAARVFGPNAIGVILSGNLDDGAAGLWAIKRVGGVAIVQDPKEALFPSMPRSAIKYVKDVDYVVPIATMTRLLVKLTKQPQHEFPALLPEHMDIEMKIAKNEDPLEVGVGRLGEPSAFACPECHGVLLRMKEADHTRFRCHTGHAYSADSLLADIRAAIEVQLWNTIRVMQEGHLLMRAMAEHVDELHTNDDSTVLHERAAELHQQVGTLREMVTSSAAPLSEV